MPGAEGQTGPSAGRGSTSFCHHRRKKQLSLVFASQLSWPMEWLRGPWRHCLSGLLLQLLLSICFFSYLRVTWDPPTGSPTPAPSSEDVVPTTPQRTPGLASTTQPPAPRGLLILLWTWPFGQPVALSRCSEMRPGTADCRITANRSVYPQADAVIVHHRDISFKPKRQLPPSPRPPGQRWVWFSLESPSHCRQLEALDGYFNLTMSYRRDSDIFTPYGWLEPRDAQLPAPPLNLTAKTKLVAWVVSNWKENSARVGYYNQLRLHLPVDVYGRGHLPLPRQDMQERLARYKFYLAFENSQHPDYITEKLWNNALGAPAVPVVLGPSRANYERVLPPDAFIHVDDFPSPRALAQHLLALDQDDAQYLRHFRWRDTLQVGIGNWTLAFCKACWRLQEGPRYQTVASIAAWFK
ncbi:3-galactosyl-N-acetylglucosaminide 4-alpha-L-fucosyltransferase FUT3-like [Cavia porcellus]|uniref:3-galactosyl-N-acetylglucosaminide 4-alpha-L-fucosyltransferase FUT3-like n=1 Tax=Cavia porcellus TaxID=10141 RepID=UPI002FE107CB